MHLEREAEDCSIAADIGKQGKKILHSLQTFSFWPVRPLLHLTSTKCHRRGSTLKRKCRKFLELLVSRHSFLSSPLLPAYVFFLCWSGCFPLSLCSADVAVNLFSTLFWGCGLVLVMFYLPVHFVGLNVAQKMKGMGLSEGESLLQG